MSYVRPTISYEHTTSYIAMSYVLRYRLLRCRTCLTYVIDIRCRTCTTYDIVWVRCRTCLTRTYDIVCNIGIIRCRTSDVRVRHRTSARIQMFALALSSAFAAEPDYRFCGTTVMVVPGRVTVTAGWAVQPRVRPVCRESCMPAYGPLVRDRINTMVMMWPMCCRPSGRGRCGLSFSLRNL